MDPKKVKIGKRVIYHPVIGGDYGEEAIIASEAYEMCGTYCCKIDIRTGVVDVEALDEL